MKVPSYSASNRQILLATYRIIKRMESTMADLQTSVTDLQTSVASLEARISGVLTELPALRTELAAAKQALVDFESADATEDAVFQDAIATLSTDLAAALEGAQTAADAIEASAAQIDQVGTEAPVEPPVEEPTP